MNPSSKPNKTSTDPVEAATQTRKKTKALKSASVPKTTQTAKRPAQTTPKAKTKALDKKPKLVHDSYSLPKDEAAALGALKRRVLALGLAVKKNNLLRAGLLTLSQLGDAALLDALRALPEPSRAAASTDTPKAVKAQAVKTKAAKPSKPAKPAKTKEKASKADKPAKGKQTAQPALEAQANATQAP